MRVAALLLLAAFLHADDDRLARDVGDPVLQRRIHEAIDRGVAYLKKVQRGGGHWSGPGAAEDFARMTDVSAVGGMTALCLYALAASGVPKEDPSIAHGVAFLLAHPEMFDPGASCATYANALLVLALTRIDPRSYRTPIHEAAGRLVAGQAMNGMWSYQLGILRLGPPARAPDRTAWRQNGLRPGTPDNSNTQFAVLGLWAAQALAGYRIEPRIWEKVREHFLRLQQPDGGWPYRKSPRVSSATMTAAGIVSLVYAITSLDGQPGAIERARRHPAVGRALPLIPFTPQIRSRWGSWLDLYLVYSIERVGTVLGLETKQCYVPGAAWLVERQGANGSWVGGMGLVMPETAKGPEGLEYPYETSLALLFLTRATRHFVTTPDGEKPVAPVTKPEEAIGTSTPAERERAFDTYVASGPEAREALARRLGGREMVGLCIERLRDERLPVRTAAFELLGRLAERRFLFDPAASAEDREVMLGPIETFGRELPGKEPDDRPAPAEGR